MNTPTDGNRAAQSDQLDQVDTAAARVEALSPVVAALEQAWAEIRTRYAEVPPAVVVVASGTEAGSLRKWGHFGAMRWLQAAGGDDLSEVMVSGEGLAREPAEVLATLLHEAAHAVAHVRDLQDTSRQGRYHNRRYAEIARQLGLQVAELPGFGLAATTLPAAAEQTWHEVLDALRAALTLSRRAEAGAGGGAGRTRASNNNPTPCVCTCPRKIRVAMTVLDAGPITCGVCGSDFEPQS
jgi:hypothetical protein